MNGEMANVPGPGWLVSGRYRPDAVPADGCPRPLCIDQAGGRHQDQAIATETPVDSELGPHRLRSVFSSASNPRAIRAHSSTPARYPNSANVPAGPYHSGRPAECSPGSAVVWWRDQPSPEFSGERKKKSTFFRMHQVYSWSQDERPARGNLRSRGLEPL